jgi:hypothetical protein
MKAFLIEFGMTPASRSRLRLDPSKGETDEEAYVRRALERASGGNTIQ